MERKKGGFYIRQIIAGSLIAVAAFAAATAFGAPKTGSGAAPVLPQTCDPAAVDAVLEAREQLRIAEENSRYAEEAARRAQEADRARQEEASLRWEEAASRRLAEAEAGYREPGWQSSAQKEEGNGDPAVWNSFREYAVLGDSRAVGFYYFRFLARDRVMASGGDTIRNIPEHYEALRRLQPDCVFFCYGLNDAGIGYWTDGLAYAEEYMERIEEIRAFLPNAEFVVSSTLPVTDEALRRSPSWKRIELLNAALAVTCPAHGVVFVDNDGIAKQYMQEYWDVDGVHLHSAFYPYWANNLIMGLRRARAGDYYGFAATDSRDRSSAEEQRE